MAPFDFELNGVWPFVTVIVAAFILLALLAAMFCWKCYQWWWVIKLEPLLPTVVTSYGSDGVSSTVAELGQVRGLENLGNTCYFSVILQMLCHTPVLGKEIDRPRETETLAQALLRFLKEMRETENRCLNPSDVFSNFCQRSPIFANGDQHDSHECLRQFLDVLKQDERTSEGTRRTKNSLTAVQKIFGGQTMTVYICRSCRVPYHVCEPFLDISLPIGRQAERGLQRQISNNSSSGPDLPQTISGSYGSERSLPRFSRRNSQARDPVRYKEAVKKIMTPLQPVSKLQPRKSKTDKCISFTDCFEYFSWKELIEDEYLCTVCNGFHTEADDLRTTSVTKQTLIINPPAVLTLHLKRFQISDAGPSLKRRDFVAYAELLDVGPYCSSLCLRNDPPIQNVWYSLYGVVVHTGSLKSGHYTSFVKVRPGYREFDGFLQREHFERDVTEDELIERIQSVNLSNPPTADARAIEGQWYHVDDYLVTEVQAETVLQQEASLLFYERIAPLTDTRC